MNEEKGGKSDRMGFDKARCNALSLFSLLFFFAQRHKKCTHNFWLLFHSKRIFVTEKMVQIQKEKNRDEMRFEPVNSIPLQTPTHTHIQYDISLFCFKLCSGQRLCMHYLYLQCTNLYEMASLAMHKICIQMTIIFLEVWFW